MSEKEEEQTTRRRKPSLYTYVLTLILVLTQLIRVLALTCVHTSLMQQSTTTLFQWSRTKPSKRQGVLGRRAVLDRNLPNAEAKRRNQTSWPAP